MKKGNRLIILVFMLFIPAMIPLLFVLATMTLKGVAKMLMIIMGSIFFVFILPWLKMKVGLAIRRRIPRKF